MADRYDQRLRTSGGALTQHVSGKSMLCASLAGVAIGGPLFGMMGFSFFATITLVLVSSPFLLICSPLLFGAAFVFVGALTGSTAAVAMAVAGWLSLARICRQVSGYLGGFRGYKRVKEQRQDFGGYLQQRVQDNSSQSQSHEHEHENRLIKVE